MFTILDMVIPISPLLFPVFVAAYVISLYFRSILPLITLRILSRLLFGSKRTTLFHDTKLLQTANTALSL